MKNSGLTPSQIARLFLLVSENPPGSNAGPWVEAIQRVGNTTKGQPWCAAFVSFVLAIAAGGRSPLPMTASCDVLLQHARKKGWLRPEPAVDDVYLRMKTPSDADHTGILTGVEPGAFTEISGNTSTGGSREGTGVFEKRRELERGRYLFIRLPEVTP